MADDAELGLGSVSFGLANVTGKYSDTDAVA